MELGQPQYRQISLLYEEDSVQLLNLATNEMVWASREWKKEKWWRKKKYTGNLELQDGTIVKEDQIVPGTGKGPETDNGLTDVIRDSIGDS